MQRFPVLEEKADAQASTLSGGQQKMLDDPRIAQLFLGGGMAAAEHVS